MKNILRDTQEQKEAAEFLKQIEFVGNGYEFFDVCLEIFWGNEIASAIEILEGRSIGEYQLNDRFEGNASIDNVAKVLVTTVKELLSEEQELIAEGEAGYSRKNIQLLTSIAEFFDPKEKFLDIAEVNGNLGIITNFNVKKSLLKSIPSAKQEWKIWTTDWDNEENLLEWLENAKKEFNAKKIHEKIEVADDRYESTGVSKNTESFEEQKRSKSVEKLKEYPTKITTKETPGFIGDKAEAVFKTFDDKSTEFYELVKELELSGMLDQEDLLFLVDTIRKKCYNAEFYARGELARKTKEFQLDPEHYKDTVVFDLDAYNFDALKVLDFFNLNEENTVVSELLEDKEIGFYVKREGSINEKN